MSGIGNINYANGVGYTDLTGLGLTSATQDTVQLDVAVSNAMSQDILNALREFREDGIINPTVEQMEAKLSAVGAAAKQTQLNELNHLLYGFQRVLQSQMAANGGDETNSSSYSTQLLNVLGNASASTRSEYFGSLGDLGQFTVSDRLNIYLPGVITNINRGFTNAEISAVITALENKIAQVSTASPIAAASANGLSTQDWLAKEMGVQTLRDSYSLSQWGEIAQKLEVNAARKASQLSLGQGGGIYQVNGQYFANGVEMSLSQINFCVRANQYSLIDQQIADQMNAIQENNETAKKANALLAAFRTAGSLTGLANEQSGTEPAGDFMNHSSSGLLPNLLNSFYGTPPADTYANWNYVINGWNHSQPLLGQVNEMMGLLKAAAPTFYSTYVRDTNGGTPYTFTGSVTYSDFDAAKTAISTYLSQNSTDNQIAQQRLETLNNTRQSVLTGMTSFTQSESQVVNRIGGNL